MATQLLLYERVTPVNNGEHADLSVKTGTDYGFARQVNSVPLMAVEFTAAAVDFAIVFAGTADAVMPAVILGVRDQQNLFLRDDGSWSVDYVPAFIRRYPFVFAADDDGKTFTLCVDESFSGCNRTGRGERLFDSEGQRTQYLQNVLGFMQEFQAQYLRTQALCAKLKAMDLLEPMQVQLRLEGGQQIGLGGFSAVSRDKLRQLGGDQLAELSRLDELELIYLHLQSIRNFSRMVDLANRSVTTPAATE